MQEFKLGLWSMLKLLFNKYIWDCFNLPYLQNTRAYSKQIFWECGGGYVPYYLGIAQAIYETYPKEVLDKIVWSGSSAGIYATIAMNISQPPSNSFQDCKSNVCLPLSQQPLGGFYNFKNKMKETMWKDYFPKFQNKYLNNDGRLFIAYFNLNVVFPFLSHFTFAYNFETNTDIIDSALASHDIPLITGLTIKHHSNPFILRFDAGWLTVLVGSLLSYNLIMPYGNNLKSSSIRFDTFRSLKPSWLWVWTEPQHLQHLFDLGYKDAMENRKLLDDIIN